MNNKISIIFMLMLSIPVLTLAQGKIEIGQKGVHEPGTGLIEPEIRIENQGNGLELQLEKEEVSDSTSSGEKVMVTNMIQEKNSTSTNRRSRVANAVQEMLQIADRQGGIGQRVREIAQNQELDNNTIEDGLKEIKNRGQFTKFLFGPNYKQIGEIEAILSKHTERTEELKQLLSQVTNEGDRTLLTMRISEMENIKSEIEKEINEEQKGFSLFGWLNKLINK